jgi:hypothetical protein
VFFTVFSFSFLFNNYRGVNGGKALYQPGRRLIMLYVFDVSEQSSGASLMILYGEGSNLRRGVLPEVTAFNVAGVALGP